MIEGHTLTVGEVWRTRVFGYPVHITEYMFCGEFPFLGRIEAAPGHHWHWCFSCDGRSFDSMDTGLDLVERIFPVMADG